MAEWFGSVHDHKFREKKLNCQPEEHKQCFCSLQNRKCWFLDELIKSQELWVALTHKNGRYSVLIVGWIFSERFHATYVCSQVYSEPYDKIIAFFKHAMILYTREYHILTVTTYYGSEPGNDPCPFQGDLFIYVESTAAKVCFSSFQRSNKIRACQSI